MFILFFICIFLFIGAAIGWTARGMFNFSGQFPTSSDRVVDEMKLQRARDYVNNPVVNELKKDNGISKR